MATNFSQLITKFNEREKSFDMAMFKKFGQRYNDYRKKYQESFNYQDLKFPIYLQIEQTFQCNLRYNLYSWLSTKIKFNANKDFL